MKQAFVGIDLGTSSVKVDLVDSDGGLLAEESAAYKTTSPQIGWAEQEPGEWWAAVWSSLRACITSARAASEPFELKGIGLTGQMHSSVLLGPDGKPLRPAIVWMDARARGYMGEVSALLAQSGLDHVLKNSPAPGLTLGPLIWLMRNQPELVEAASKLLIAKDYVRYQLSGQVATDPSDASGTLMLDIERRSWSSDLCGLFGIPETILPEIRSPWEPAGVLRAELTHELGLSQAPVIAVGCGDQAAAAIGAGVLEPGVMQLMLGTGAQVMSPVSSGGIVPPRSLNMFCLHELWSLQGSIQNAGSALNWMRSSFHAEWDEVMRTAETRPYGPVFLPYLTGERAPIMDERASGAFLGVRYGAEREHLIFAVVEGVVQGICDAVEEVSRVTAQDAVQATEHASPGAPGELRCGGGGAANHAYVQLLADYLGRPLSVLDRSGSTALGAAILGAVASGAFPGLPDAIAHMGLKIGKIVSPDQSRRAEARERRSEFRLRRDRYLETERLLRGDTGSGA